MGQVVVIRKRMVANDYFRPRLTWKEMILFGLERNQQELEIITDKELEIIFGGNEFD